MDITCLAVDHPTDEHGFNALQKKMAPVPCWAQWSKKDQDEFWISETCQWQRIVWHRFHILFYQVHDRGNKVPRRRRTMAFNFRNFSCLVLVVLCRCSFYLLEGKIKLNNKSFSGNAAMTGGNADRSVSHCRLPRWRQWGGTSASIIGTICHDLCGNTEQLFTLTQGTWHVSNSTYTRYTQYTPISYFVQKQNSDAPAAIQRQKDTTETLSGISTTRKRQKDTTDTFRGSTTTGKHRPETHWKMVGHRSQIGRIRPQH